MRGASSHNSRVSLELIREVIPSQMLVPGDDGYQARAARHDPAAPWVTLSANHMLPSRSSLFHPHMQGAVDPYPTTFQRILAEVPSGRFDDYLATEKALAERYLGSTGGVEWLASFAPVGFHQLRALVPGLRSPDQL